MNGENSSARKLTPQPWAMSLGNQVMYINHVIPSETYWRIGNLRSPSPFLSVIAISLYTVELSALNITAPLCAPPPYLSTPPLPLRFAISLALLGSRIGGGMGRTLLYRDARVAPVHGMGHNRIFDRTGDINRYSREASDREGQRLSQFYPGVYRPRHYRRCAFYSVPRSRESEFVDQRSVGILLHCSKFSVDHTNNKQQPMRCHGCCLHISSNVGGKESTKSGSEVVTSRESPLSRA